MNRRKKGSLNWNMFRLLVLCWVLPLMLLTIGMLYLSTSKNKSQMKKTIVTSSKKVVENFETRLDMAMTASKNVSYTEVVKKSYLNYLETEDKQKLYKDITLYLNQQYRYNNTIASTMLFFLNDPYIVYHTYSNAAGATYQTIEDFKKNALGVTREYAYMIHTGIKFLNVDGHLLMIRNLVMPDFRPYAVVVMDMNVDGLVQSFHNILWYYDSVSYLDGSILKSSKTGFEKKRSFAKNITIKDGYYYDSKNALMYLEVPIEKQEFLFVIKLDRDAIVNEQDVIIYIFLILIIFMIPLIILIFYFFYVNVMRPMRDLISISHEIEEGNFGIQMEEFYGNREFNYLVETFNKMSLNLKNLFGKIYLEEIALRDANILALQSQINPHFMNNTLEIINWEARMAGNESVSKMIEALSVMLEATMDRKKQHLIPLSEELSYIDAYIYIISKRFGKLFQFKREVDEALLDVKVPRLIIQPIIENAVEHGGNNRGYKDVTLKIYKNDDDVIIEVTNNGEMSQEDKIKINKLLNEGPDENEKANNLGISNVNKRLNIIYGEGSGLFIEQGEEGVISKIIIHHKGEVNIYEKEKN